MRRDMSMVLVAVVLVAAGVASAGERRALSLAGGRVEAVAVDGTLVLEDGTRVLAPRPVPGVVPGADVTVTGTSDEGGIVPLRIEVVAGDRGGAADWRGRDRRFTGVAQADGWMEQMEVRGSVLAIVVGGFELEPEDSGMPWWVEVDAGTEWIGVSGLGCLGVGDRVRVQGGGWDHTLTAELVELLSSDGGGGDDGGGEGDDGGGEGDDGGGEGDDGGGGGDDGAGGGYGGHEAYHDSDGWVEALLPPNRFRLDDGRTYRSDAATVWDSAIGGYTGLHVGDFVEVHAGYAGGELLAYRVELESEHGTTRRETLSGTVVSVSVDGVVLEGGVSVAFGPRTEFEGDAERWTDIQPGWWVEVEAVQMMHGGFLALEVRADDRTPPTLEGESYEPRRALVIVAAGVDPQTVAERHGAQVLGSISSVASLFEWPLEIDDALLAALDGDPEVLAVEPNYLFRDPESLRKRYPIVDRSASTSEFTGQPALSAAGVPGAGVVASGSGIVVAVMDTGVDPLHPALRGRLGEPGLDTVDGDLEPWETLDGVDEDGDGDVDEAAGHGTFVASVVGLVASGTTIVPYRVLDDDGGGTAYGLALALADAIRRHVDVINLSLAYTTPSAVVDALLAEAERRGIVVVVSAGNDGAAELPYPASDGHTVAVTALAADGLGLASFANTGPSPILAGPGEDVYGALHERQWGTSSGSSMAAPFVSGAVALLLELDPGLDPALVREVLVQTARAITDGGATDGALTVGAAVAVVAP